MASPPSVVKNIVDCCVILVNKTTDKKRLTWAEGRKLLGSMDLQKQMAQVSADQVTGKRPFLLISNI